MVQKKMVRFTGMKKVFINVMGRIGLEMEGDKLVTFTGVVVSKI